MDPMEFDDSMNYKKDLMKEGLITGADTQRRKSPSLLVIVCLGLLCAILFCANIGQIIHYNKLSNQKETESEARLSNMMTERNQFEQNYSSLRQDRDKVQRERDGLQRNYSTLRTEKETLQSSCEDVKREKEQLETNNRDLTTDRNNLQREKKELQTEFNNMKTNRDELQRNYSSVKSEKDQLETRFNTLQREKDDLLGNYSALVTVKRELEEQIEKLKVVSCESGWKVYNSSCYYVSTSKETWSRSRSYCQTKGADLVIINSGEERTFVAGLVSPGQNTWIGLSDDIREGIWKWVDGTHVTTTYWEDGQPNSHGGDQDCGEMVQRGEWNDETCTTRNIWICEK